MTDSKPQRELDFPYTFGWGNNSRRADLKGHACRVLTKGRMRSCLIEFENGERIITSQRALRGR